MTSGSSRGLNTSRDFHGASTSAEDAFLHAVRAQRGPLWRGLLKRALTCEDTSCVVAGIVLSHPVGPAADETPTRQFLCVSLGSGTRCVGLSEREGAQSDTVTDEDVSSLVLHDGHAEVMARRGFVAFLLDAAAQLMHGSTATFPPDVVHPFLGMGRFLSTSSSADSKQNPNTPDEVGGFALRSDVRVHLVCTHWPCGALGLAASGTTGGKIVLETPSRRLALPHGLSDPHFMQPSDTKAVRGHVLAAHRSAVDQEAAVAQVAARVKPGKGHGNLNMSCTDKVWRWSTLGLQGRRRETILPQPILLTALHVVRQRHIGSPPAPIVSTVGLADCATCDTAWPCIMAYRDDAVHRAHSCQSEAAPPPQRSTLTVHVREVDWSHTLGADESTDSIADSKYSRSAWAQVRSVGNDGAEAPPLGVKRGRDADNHSWQLTWPVRNAAAVNTKAGLPQGVSMAQLPSSVESFSRRNRATSNGACDSGDTDVACMTASDAVQRVCSFTSKFPLSRAWFAQRTLGVLLARRSGPEAHRPTLSHPFVCHGALSSLVDKTQLEAKSDPTRWFFNVAVPFLDECLRSDAISLAAKDAETGRSHAFLTGGSARYWLYGDDATMLAVAQNVKPTTSLLWAEKTNAHGCVALSQSNV